jgi:hypothetical protein
LIENVSVVIYNKRYVKIMELYPLEAVRINNLSDELKAAERIMRGAVKRETDRGGR